MRRIIIAALVGATILSVRPAESRVFVGIDMPLYFPPPIYVPLPTYYPPPPPPYYGYDRVLVPTQRLYPTTCQAGPYICPLAHPQPAGTDCTCIGNEGGRVIGRSN